MIQIVAARFRRTIQACHRTSPARDILVTRTILPQILAHYTQIKPESKRCADNSSLVGFASPEIAAGTSGSDLCNGYFLRYFIHLTHYFVFRGDENGRQEGTIGLLAVG
jgi:hypothetical protein